MKTLLHLPLILLALACSYLLPNEALADRHVRLNGWGPLYGCSRARPCSKIAWAVAMARAGETIHVQEGLYEEHAIQINKDLTILGAGSDVTVIDAQERDSVIKVGERNGASPVVTIEGLTITGGNSTLFGGGIEESRGDLTVNDCFVSGNKSSRGGGGIFASGKLTVNDSSVVANHTTDDTLGGGILVFKSRAVTINRSVVAYNMAYSGAGIDAISSVLTINDTTITGNQAIRINDAPYLQPSGAGMSIYKSSAVINGSSISANMNDGIELSDSLVFVNQSTISGNTGFGIRTYIEDESEIQLRSSIVAYNRLGPDAIGAPSSGIFGTGVTGMKNTIVAHNTAADGSPLAQCSHALVSEGFNLVSDDSCGLDASLGDKFGTLQQPLDPRLGPLKQNGGPTLTHALLIGSPAIDAGDPTAGCLVSDTAREYATLTDQRGAGFSRRRDGDGDGQARCDIGAYEAQQIMIDKPEKKLRYNGKVRATAPVPTPFKPKLPLREMMAF